MAYCIMILMTPKYLKKWRMEHGYTQTTLAQALESHPMTISKWERGEREIPKFLYLALRYLELKGGGLTEKGNRKRKGE